MINNLGANLQAHEYIEKIKSSLEDTNRYFASEEFIKYLDSICNTLADTIEPETIWYRSRIVNETDKDEIRRSKDEIFRGYSKEKSYVNYHPSWADFGRMNAKGIVVLYASSDEKTSIKELHPSFEEIVSIAEIEVKQKIKIVDFSKSNAFGDDMFLAMLSVYIQEYISVGYSEKDYIFSQFVSSYCKLKGYDGVAYRSKYSTREQIKTKNEGINYVIFYTEKCDAISSFLKKITNVTVTSCDTDRSQI